MLQGLLANLVVLALCISVWVHVQPMLEGGSKLRSRLAFAAIMGLGATSAILLSNDAVDGVPLDLQSSLLMVSGFVGGPLVGLIVAAVAIPVRLLVGGHGDVAECASIIVAAAVGSVFGLVVRGGRPSLMIIGLIGCLAGGIPLLGLAMLDAPTAHAILASTGPWLYFLNAVATIAACVTLLRAQRSSEGRHLLRAAIRQSPDFLYVKDTKGQIVATNLNVARYYGRRDPDELRGLTDFDLAVPARARDLFFSEQRVIRTGLPISDQTELVVEKDGAARWFITSKAAVRDESGRTIGIAGVTRDVTERRQLEADLARSRDQLGYVLQDVSDGIAMYDAEARLVFCNEQYRAAFPLTGAFRHPGTRLEDILRKVLETGEQTYPSTDAGEAWVTRTTQTLSRDGEEDIRHFDGRWLRIMTRITRDGSAITVVSDITALKRAEAQALADAAHLKALASTDALTGLPNRRSFDETISREFQRAADEGKALSLMMLDVDRFKNFNDIYGHPAGDECLRKVAACLVEAAGRGTDFVARYGGEEFVALLSETGLDGARSVADKLQGALAARSLAHEGSEKKFVTISIGVATLDGSETISMAEFFRRADEALYLAKSSGRDQCVVWTPAECATGSTAA